MTRDEELLAINTLLLRVFKTSKFADPSYLRWQYFQAPEGQAVFTNYFEDDLCRAHYCVLPQNYLFGRTVYRMALSLNTAVDPAFRLKGLFTNLANETYAKAKEEHGIRAILGVANANSTPGFLRRLGFSLLGPLPVGIGFCLQFFKRVNQSRTFRVSEAFLHSANFREILQTLDFQTTSGFVQHWSEKKLRWRLSNPRGNYRLHDAPEGILITQTAYYKKLQFVIVLKFFSKKGTDEIDYGPLVQAACKEAGTPLFLYAGYNTRVKVPLFPVPKRFQPSPLNLIIKSLDATTVLNYETTLEAFEFLDFDAY